MAILIDVRIQKGSCAFFDDYDHYTAQATKGFDNAGSFEWSQFHRQHPDWRGHNLSRQCWS